MKTFKKVGSELSVIRSGHLLKGTKNVVPTKPQERVVDVAAYQGHQGMVNRKLLIREKVWFLGRKESEETVKWIHSCEPAKRQFAAHYEQTASCYSKVSRFKSVKVKMEPPIKHDLMENDSMNYDIPIKVSQAENSATRSTVAGSRYSSRSTKNKKPAWMKDYVNK
ncbi:hypothetical protein LSH36_2929g00006 [Paralvinella palmiformis]|uniref:Integrase zinc-binding domain-containing protein n=1 Tax=Paralvinella palmiformis TaxID=53620 RepID=A0AAD9IPU4_9ANNE|nr:hypothetical protein LSH36_2929g00006 [Paralvinella palmiformis]